MKILLAEDTRDLNRALTAAFTHEGYEVDSAFDGEKAYELLMKTGYDCIILDIMMPKKDGLAVLKELRAAKISTPVLLLTAKAEIEDRVKGLDNGADDYLTKPFALAELLARVRSLIRRGSDTPKENSGFADITLNRQTLELSAFNTVRLSSKEFELMQFLIDNADREVDCDFIGAQIWGKEQQASKEEIWLYISYLKGKLESIGSRVKISGSIGGSYQLNVSDSDPAESEENASDPGAFSYDENTPSADQISSAADASTENDYEPQSSSQGLHL